MKGSCNFERIGTKIHFFFPVEDMNEHIHENYEKENARLDLIISLIRSG